MSKKTLGTANALYSARSFVTDDYFLVLMGDYLSNFDIENLIYSNSPTVLGYMVNDLSRSGTIVIDSDSIAYEISEKKERSRGLANNGAYLMLIQFFELYSKISSNKAAGEFYLTDIVKMLYDQGSGFRVTLMYYWRPLNDAGKLENTIEDLSKFDYLSLKIRNATINNLSTILNM
ncbi:MAG: sugar phosphate nucleotidyltransferase [Candidatus Micrarchaeaceae archaeon]